MSLCCFGGVCIPTSAIIPLLLLALKWILDQLASFGIIPAKWSKALGCDNTTTTTTTTSSRQAESKQHRGKKAATNTTTTTSNGDNENDDHCCHDGACRAGGKTTTTTKKRNGEENETKVTYAANSSEAYENGRIVSSGDGIVSSLESAEEWQRLLQDVSRSPSSSSSSSPASNASNGEVVAIAKFTATWCKPCKAIAPKFAQLAERYGSSSAAAAAAAAKNHRRDAVVVRCVEVDVDDFDEIASSYKVAMMPTFVAIGAGAGGAPTTKELGRMMGGSDPDQLEDFFRRHVVG